jgi:conjugal transfer pilus assembly protein TraL
METRIPRHVDLPQLILAWTIDEILPVLVLLVVGIVTDYFFTCLALGVGLLTLVRRFRESKPDGYLLYWLYWHGLLPLTARTAINPFQRRIDP